MVFFFLYCLSKHLRYVYRQRVYHNVCCVIITEPTTPVSSTMRYFIPVYLSHTHISPRFLSSLSFFSLSLFTFSLFLSSPLPPLSVSRFCSRLSRVQPMSIAQDAFATTTLIDADTPPRPTDRPCRVNVLLYTHATRSTVTIHRGSNTDGLAVCVHISITGNDCDERESANAIQRVEFMTTMSKQSGPTRMSCAREQGFFLSKLLPTTDDYGLNKKKTITNICSNVSAYG